VKFEAVIKRASIDNTRRAPPTPSTLVDLHPVNAQLSTVSDVVLPSEEEAGDERFKKIAPPLPPLVDVQMQLTNV
jgi:hypothetical protein